MDKTQLEAQRIMQNLPAGPPPSVNVQTIGGVCPQCGLIHPPLRPGEKCPNAPIEKNEAGIDDGDVHKHLVDMRNIILSKMKEKNIKDGKKFFQYAVIELTKALEKYTGE